MSGFYTLKILTQPVAGWQALAAAPGDPLRRGLTLTLILALIPALSWFYGATQVGWQIGLEEERQRLTVESALYICAMFYLAMVIGVLFISYMIHWMASTYAADSSFGKGVLIVAYTATPFFLGGILGLYPSLWLDLSIGVLVACYCVYLLYLGVPIVMNIEPERGFLFASAVVAVALVSLVAAMGATVILWDMGLEPVYTY